MLFPMGGLRGLQPLRWVAGDSPSQQKLTPNAGPGFQGVCACAGYSQEPGLLRRRGLGLCSPPLPVWGLLVHHPGSTPAWWGLWPRDDGPSSG